MKNLINAIREEEKKRLEDFINEVKKVKAIQDMDKWQYNGLLPKGKKIVQFTNVKDAKAYVIARKEKKIYKTIEDEIKGIETVMNSGTFESIKITIEWKRSAMWGSNPRAEAWMRFVNADGQTDIKYAISGYISGCGYDKQSTAVAEVLNQFNEVLKPLYLMKNQPKNINKHNRDVFGYGAGYGILPKLEGGVGVSCYPAIFAKIGYKFETVASGKNFDVYQITKISKK